MTEVLHLGALLPAAVGACCTVGGRRGALELGSALVMLAAMIDLAAGVGVVHPFVWGLLLLGTAVISAARLRVVRRSSRDADQMDRSDAGATPAHRARMVVHTSGGLVIMAALVCAMSTHTANARYTGNGISSAAHHAAGMSFGALLLVGAIAVYLALSAKVALDAARSRQRLVAVEAVSMAVSVAAMGLATAL